MIKGSDKYFREDVALNNCYLSTTSKTNPLLIKLILKCWLSIFLSVLWRYFYRQQRWDFVTKKVNLWVPQNSYVSSLPPKADLIWDSQNSSESSPVGRSPHPLKPISLECAEQKLWEALTKLVSRSTRPRISLKRRQFSEE